VCEWWEIYYIFNFIKNNCAKSVKFNHVYNLFLQLLRIYIKREWMVLILNIIEDIGILSHFFSFCLHKIANLIIFKYITVKLTISKIWNYLQYINGLREIQLFAKYYICNYVIARVYAKSHIKIFLFTFKLQDYLSLYKLRDIQMLRLNSKYGEGNKLFSFILAPVKAPDSSPQSC